MKWNRVLLGAIAVFTALMLAAVAPAVRADDGGNGATVTTDKPDYHPEETVLISGTAFLADSTVTVMVTRPNGDNSSWDVTTDNSGGFSTTYELDGIQGIYTVVASDGTSTASTTFTDSAADLDQCTNGGVDKTPEPCRGSNGFPVDGFKNWVNGNANGEKAHWKEGQFISYRVTLEALTVGTHTLEAHYDTVHGGTHAIDYLGSFDATETTSTTSTPNNANHNDPCADKLPSGQCTPSSPADSFPIPAATLVNCAGSSGTPPSQIPGDVKIFGTGADITGFTYVAENVPQGGGQCSTTFDITFTVPSGTSTVVIAWGGHISSQFDWGTGNSASFINGSPYHMSLDTLDGNSVGSQDRALATSAIILTFLVVIKHVINDNGGTAIAFSFTMTVTGANPQASSFPGMESPGVTITIDPGAFGVTEAGPSGYSASFSGCSGTIVAGTTTTCTITNSDNPTDLTLVKHVTNDNGGTAVATDWTLSATGPTPLSGAGGASGNVLPGTYTLSETGPTGYAASGWSCVGGSQNANQVTLLLGESSTCTITNDDIPAHLTLVKHVTNDNGGTRVATDWTLSATGPTPLSGAGGAEGDVSAGMYTLSETGPAGYTPSAWSCTGGTLVGNQLTLTVGQSATCTITNDDVTAHLTLVKQVTNDNGGTRVNTEWTLDASGPTPLSGSGGADGDVNAGMYTLSERGPTDYTASAWSCIGGSQNGNVITVALGQSATCTITNDDKAPSLTLIKYVMNDNGGTAVATDWTLTASGPTPISGAGGATSDSTFSAGTYTLSESGGPFGYSPSSWSCAGGSQNGGQITLVLGQTATCSITNDDIQPKLIVIKHVITDNGGTAVAGDFTMSVAGSSPSPASFPGAESPGTTVAINAGAYNVGEGGPGGYASSFSTDCSGSILVGQTKTCTVTNDDIAPKLIVVKHVINDNGGTATASSFAMTVTGTNVQPSGSFPGAESPGTTVTLDVGAYGVSEAGPSGYASSFSGDCSGSIALGETKTCTITNDDKAPKLTLVKAVVNGETGTASPTDWTLTASGPTPISGAGGATSGPTFSAGTYTLSESAGSSGYDPSPWSCSGDGTQNGNQITLGLGQSATCGITNTKRGMIKVLKFTFPSGDPQSFHFTLYGDPAFPSGLPFSLTDGGSFTSQGLPPGAYSVSEAPTSGWALMSASCDHGNAPGAINLQAGQLVTCRFTNAHSGFVTDSALCAFDRDPNRDGQQFRLLLTQDPASPSTYKVTATNPGQTFYNIILDDAGVPTTHTVTMTFPYPYVTQGAVPIHVYDSVRFVTQNGMQCLVPGTSYFTSSQQVTLASYGGGSFGSFATLTVTFTSTGFGYLNVHMDYGLKATTGWSKGGVSGNDAIGSGAYSGVTIHDLGTYTFSFTASGDGSSSTDIQNENAFKKDPGFAGLVTNSAGNAVAGVTVQIFNPDGSLLATAHTDVDGVYSYVYKYTGKGAYFTISLPDYGQSKQVYVKSNSFVWVNFQVL